MKIEIVDAYFMARNDKKGTFKASMHIYLIDIDVDLRGILVNKRKNGWFFHMPHFKNLAEDKVGAFPVFNFVTQEKNRSLMEEIIRLGKPFMIKKFEDTKGN